MNYKLIIGWLYPDLMSIYGDRGNVIVLQKRCEWRGIDVEVRSISLESTEKELAACDLLLMGGAQDSQQTIVAKDLQKKKKTLQEMIESGIPGLYICGGFQFLGKYYKEADGTVIEQLGILDIYTENPGNRRLIGNIAVDVSTFFYSSSEAESRIEKSTDNSFRLTDVRSNNILVGFENHGGRTVLGKGVLPLGKVVRGFGSNDSAKEEGAVYKNSIGTYLHGPILPKNPELADWLIIRALERKYKKHVILGSGATPESKKERSVPASPKLQRGELGQDDIIVLPSLDDSIAKKAKEVILSRLGI